MPSQLYYVTPEGASEPVVYTVDRLDETRVQITYPDGRVGVFDVRAFGNVLNILTPNSESVEIHVATDHDQYRVTTVDLNEKYTVLNDRKYRMAQVSGDGSGDGGPELHSPMAGKVVLLKVAQGDTVHEGDVVIIIEAMKMENDLKAHISGKIASIEVAPGDIVDIGQTLLTIESTEESE